MLSSAPRAKQGSSAFEENTGRWSHPPRSCKAAIEITTFASFPEGALSLHVAQTQLPPPTYIPGSRLMRRMPSSPGWDAWCNGPVLMSKGPPVLGTVCPPRRLHQPVHKPIPETHVTAWWLRRLALPVFQFTTGSARKFNTWGPHPVLFWGSCTRHGMQQRVRAPLGNGVGHPP